MAEEIQATITDRMSIGVCPGAGTDEAVVYGRWNSRTVETYRTRNLCGTPNPYALEMYCALGMGHLYPHWGMGYSLLGQACGGVWSNAEERA
jgi:hypothetical protein